MFQAEAITARAADS